MKISTFNINNVNKRLANLVGWLAAAEPDVVCLQELKAEQRSFPHAALAEAGYGAVWLGERTWNGVAILARGAEPILTRDALPGDERDRQARYIEAAVRGVIVASIYLPNGNPIGTDKFAYKLAWMERLVGHARDLLRREIPFVLAGDYNICPADGDVYDPVGWRDDALCRIESRARFRALMHLGLTDAYRVFHHEPHHYTFWDYQAGRWHRDEGLRIDHLLLSPHAADRVAACDIDKKPRAMERASDHTPIWCELAV